MTDKEIKKALEHCISTRTIGACNGCPFNDINLCKKDIYSIEKYALDLINRQEAKLNQCQQDLQDLTLEKVELFDIATEQKAEIERLEEFASSKCEDCAGCTAWKCDCANIEGYAKAEAIKEFAERLKKDKTTAISLYKFTEVVRVTDIDNLLKEMVGDGE